MQHCDGAFQSPSDQLPSQTSSYSVMIPVTSPETNRNCDAATMYMCNDNAPTEFKIHHRESNVVQMEVLRLCFNEAKNVLEHQRNAVLKGPFNQFVNSGSLHWADCELVKSHLQLEGLSVSHM